MRACPAAGARRRGEVQLDCKPSAEGGARSWYTAFFTIFILRAEALRGKRAFFIYFFLSLLRTFMRYRALFFSIATRNTVPKLPGSGSQLLAADRSGHRIPERS